MVLDALDIEADCCCVRAIVFGSSVVSGGMEEGIALPPFKLEPSTSYACRSVVYRAGRTNNLRVIEFSVLQTMHEGRLATAVEANHDAAALVSAEELGSQGREHSDPRPKDTFSRALSSCIEGVST